ncbi:MAG: FIST C-terminal domain-containing protein [Gemmatimonadota bacterium]|nr:FIST C-terminal domain-containing protein [Gemmatimonadota bacterium]
MQTEQIIFETLPGWSNASATSVPDADLVLLIGGREEFGTASFFESIRERYPSAAIVSITAPDVIAGTTLIEKGGAATAIKFDSSRVAAVEEGIKSASASEEVGATLGQRLDPAGLRHVLVFSEGINVNGTGLVRGLAKTLPRGTTITGGLASDGAAFEQTKVGLNSTPTANRAVAVGLYGAALSVGMGSLGGWEPFGNEMVVTRSEGNVLFELDGEAALSVYKRVLGPRSFALPASGLLFPLEIRSTSGKEVRTRTLLAVDELAGSVTFAGDVPQGFRARLMQANLDRLIDAAGTAAENASANDSAPDFVLLVSCIGRKLLLQLRTAEEIENARNIFGPRACVAGFYSYGEVSPLNPSVACELHNQTMTITTISERR